VEGPNANFAEKNMERLTKDLIGELKNYTLRHIELAGSFKNNNPDGLNRKASKDSWSALECMEHLCLYGDFYLPEIERRIAGFTGTPSKSFRSGWLGNYFANSMLPKEKLNKMTTFKNMDPANGSLSVRVIDRFLAQQQKMLVLLERAERTNLSKVKTSITLTKLIRLQLGDTLRFVIFHNERHMQQAQIALLQI
jgi:hypothetical protein